MAEVDHAEMLAVPAAPAGVVAEAAEVDPAVLAAGAAAVLANGSGAAEAAAARAAEIAAARTRIHRAAARFEENMGMQLVAAHGERIGSARADVIARLMRRPESPSFGYPSFAPCFEAFLRASGERPSWREWLSMVASRWANWMQGYPATLDELLELPPARMTRATAGMLIEAWYCSGDVGYLRRLQEARQSMPRHVGTSVEFDLSRMKKIYPSLATLDAPQ